MNKKIVIVEDTRQLLDSIVFFLEMEGFEVFPFTHAENAIQALKNIVPHLIITDLSMPDVDGFEFIQKIKSETSLQNVPIAIFSARPKQENLSIANNLGVNRYISKPCTVEKLLEEINDILAINVQIEGHE